MEHDIEQDTDIPEPLRSALMPIVEKWQAAGWKIHVMRPAASTNPGPRLVVDVTSPDGAVHKRERVDEDDSLPNKIDELIKSLSH